MDDNFSLGYAMGQNSNGGNNCGGWGMNGWGDWILIILLFAVLGGGYGGFGFGGFGGFGGGAGFQGMATRADINEGFALNNITSGITAIQQGICDSTYAINNGIRDLGLTTMQGFNGLSSQLAQCCCDTRAAIQGVNTGIERTGWNLSKQISDCCCDIEKMNMQSRFDAQGYNCNTLQAIDKLGDRIIDYMAAEKTQALRDENQALRLQASQAQQNAFIAANQEAQTAELIRRLGADCPTPSFLVNPPTPVNFPVNRCGTVQFGGQGGCGCVQYA